MELLGIESQKKYFRCFIGIPLPEEYQNEFRGVLLDLSHLDSDLDLVDENTPHILLSYLGNLNGQTLLAIGEKIDQELDFPDISLEVKGVSFFQNGNRKVIYLTVSNGVNLTNFALKIREAAKEYAVKEKEFTPHLTVARKRGVVSVSQEISDRLEAVDWRFELAEIAVYGAVAEEGKVHQKKMIRWKKKV